MHISIALKNKYFFIIELGRSWCSLLQIIVFGLCSSIFRVSFVYRSYMYRN